MLRGGPSKACLTDTVERAAVYLAAGVDCIYPIGVTELADIARLVEGVDSSVNVGFAGTATIEELAALGVARISFRPAAAAPCLRQPWNTPRPDSRERKRGHSFIPDPRALSAVCRLIMPC